MKAKINFLREQLLSIPCHEICFEAYPDCGGCDAYGDAYVEYTLSQQEIFGIISKEIQCPSLFKGLSKKTVSKRYLNSLAKDACFPDGEFDGSSRLPSVSFSWEDAVDEDEFIQEIIAVIKSFLDDKIDQEEVLERFSRLN